MDLGHGLVYLRLFHPHPPTERKKTSKTQQKRTKPGKVLVLIQALLASSASSGWEICHVLCSELVELVELRVSSPHKLGKRRSLPCRPCHICIDPGKMSLLRATWNGVCMNPHAHVKLCCNGFNGSNFGSLLRFVLLRRDQASPSKLAKL